MRWANDKGLNQSPNRFEVGTHGGGEASFFEFSEKQSPELYAVRIAALGLTSHWPTFAGKSQASLSSASRNLGIIVIVSGSPVD